MGEAKMRAGGPRGEILAKWFPLRDKLCGLRDRDSLTDSDDECIWGLLNDLVVLADDLIAADVPDVPDVAARCRITGESQADVMQKTQPNVPKSGR